MDRGQSDAEQTISLTSDLDHLVLAVMHGNGSALKPYLEMLGFEQRVALLRRIADKSRWHRQQNKALPALVATLNWVPEDDAVADSKMRHHLSLQLSTEVARLFPGRCLYEESLFVYAMPVHRDARYYDLQLVKITEKEQQANDELLVQLEDLNVKMCVPVMERLFRTHNIEDLDAALAKLQDIEWLEDNGYSHVAHILSSESGAHACKQVFEKRAKND